MGVQKRCKWRGLGGNGTKPAEKGQQQTQRRRDRGLWKTKRRREYKILRLQGLAKGVATEDQDYKEEMFNGGLGSGQKTAKEKKVECKRETGKKKKTAGWKRPGGRAVIGRLR